MTTTVAGDFFPIQQAVSGLLRWSDARDTELRARFAVVAAAQQHGYDAGFEAGRRAALENFAAEKRQLAAEIAGLPSRPPFAEFERIRWAVRGEPRTRLAFGDPHPGDYLGGPVRWSA